MTPELKLAVQKLELEGRPALIALSGYSGSGKSTVARTLKAELPDTEVIESDVFWIPEDNRLSEDWSSIDRSRLMSEVLLPARLGQPVVYTPFDWENVRLGEPVTVSRCRRMIVEGIGILHPDLEGLFDLKVWIDAPFELAMGSGMRRDREEYGLENEAEWRDVWIPNERAYFGRYRPDLMADLIVPWFGDL